jgi:ribonuclease HI
MSAYNGTKRLLTSGKPQKLDTPLYVFACDGSYKKSIDRWGWGVTIRIHEFRINWSGHGIGCTNNIGEMTAMLMVLQNITYYCDPTVPILVKSDSKYVLRGIINDDVDIMVCGINGWIKNWMKNDWKTSNKEPVKNKELWISIHTQLSAILLNRKATLVFQWVKGHDQKERSTVKQC